MTGNAPLKVASWCSTVEVWVGKLMSKGKSVKEGCIINTSAVTCRRKRSWCSLGRSAAGMRWSVGSRPANAESRRYSWRRCSQVCLSVAVRSSLHLLLCCVEAFRGHVHDPSRLVKATSLTSCATSRAHHVRAKLAHAEGIGGGTVIAQLIYPGCDRLVRGYGCREMICLHH